ncbi:MAG: hypothetical protein Q8P89_01160 [bacterium]|nr:hypothetical protein [bacterium]
MRHKEKSRIFSFTITKRQKFVSSTVILTSGLVVTQLLGSDSRFLIVGLLSVVAYFISAFALREDLTGIKWITLLVLPMMYTLAVGLSYFLLPTRWITRLPVALLYALGIYALLLTENIYSVAVARTIQLLRAAHAVGFLLTLATAFLLFHTLLSFHLPFWLNFPGVFLIALPLLVQALWSVKLEEGITPTVAQYGFFLSLIIAELALALSFWPSNITLWALFLTAAVYALLGVSQQHFAGRLFKRTAIEFFLVPSVIILILFFSTSWGG